MARIKPTEPKKKIKAPEWLFANITEASKNARKIYFLYIGFLFYCSLTVVGSPDRNIILNERVRLPLLNVEVPIIGFFSMAPLTAIFIFIYLQLYLSRLKWLINLLTPIEKGYLYPWMLNFPKDPDSGLTKVFQEIIIKFSLWGLLPLVLILFAIWSVKTHNPFLPYIVGIFPIFGVSVVFLFWWRYEGVQSKFFSFILKDPGKIVLILIMIAFELGLLLEAIPKAREGKYFTLDLSNEKLITEPTHDYEGMYWGHFAGVHLEGANLEAAILKRADLSNAHLQGAKMDDAILRGANLTEADLRGANLRGADLTEADFGVADLSGADLSGANLMRVDLSKANLSEANLRGANLEEATLSGAVLKRAVLNDATLSGANLKIAILTDAYLRRADLSGADLSGATLSGADLIGAILNDANLMNAFLKETNFSLALLYKAVLNDATLSGANLRVANLSGANLSGANLSGASLDRAFLIEADLREAKNLTIEQLSKVETLYEAKLDPELEKQIKEKYPHLLEKPEWIKEEE